MTTKKDEAVHALNRIEIVTKNKCEYDPFLNADIASLREYLESSEEDLDMFRHRKPEVYKVTRIQPIG